MEFPKQWGPPIGGSSFGKLNSLRQGGLPFQSSSVLDDGSVARTKGAFSEIIAGPQGYGWYTNSGPKRTGLPIQIFTRRAPTGLSAFSVAGQATSPVSENPSYFLSPTGNGYAWYYVQPNNASGGLETFFFSITYNGGVSSVPGFTQGIPVPSIEVLYGEGFRGMDDSVFNVQAANEGASFLWVNGVQFLTQDTTRQVPLILLFEFLNGVFGVGSGNTPTLAVNKDYTVPNLVFITPQVLALITAHAGDLPKLYLSVNTGSTWDGGTDLTPCFPSENPGTINPESSFPGGIAAQRNSYLSQVSVQRRMGSAHVHAYPLTRKRMLIYTNYETGGGTGFQSVETVFDITTGAVISQTVLSTTDVYDAALLGQGAWLRFRETGIDPVITSGATADTFKVTTNYGAAFTPAVLPGSFRNIAPIVGAYIPGTGGNPNTNPVVYWVGDPGDGSKNLYRSPDLFQTVTSAVIAPTSAILNPSDFDNVTWIGSNTGLGLAPIDPRFPWRVDSRVGIPTWYQDGVLPP